MRTAVEIADDQHARLLEIAAARGQKDLWGVLQEAISLPLKQEAQRCRVTQRALESLGSLGSDEAGQMLATARTSPGSWR